MADSAAGLYDRYWREGVDGWEVTARLSTGLADLLRSVSSGKDVLDYGGGDGRRYAQVLRESASTYTVADVSPLILESCRSLGDQVVAIDSLPSVSLTVDTLVMLEVLEHLLDPLKALAGSMDKVRPGGTVVLSVPNAFNAWNRVRMLAGRLPASGVGGRGVRGRTWVAPHIRFFDWASLVSLATEAGIETEAAYADGLNLWKFGARSNGRLRILDKQKPHLLAETLVLVGRKGN